MPLENLEEEGLPKNPDLRIAQLRFLLSLPEHRGDAAVREELMAAVRDNSEAPRAPSQRPRPGPAPRPAPPSGPRDPDGLLCPWGFCGVGEAWGTRLAVTVVHPLPRQPRLGGCMSRAAVPCPPGPRLPGEGGRASEQ
jgi:hypothetical protein